MNAIQRDPKYFVVGGVVQPGRDCYLQRRADAELYQRLADGEFCHVLAQPQSGKTSLAAATAARLRGEGYGVALVDLIQASEEDPSANAGRWYYSIVYRIARDLRIKADLQRWWAERGGLTNLQRLREFFQEIVLQETEQPVVVFFDRLEAVCDEPLARDLLAAIRACYDARATIPDFNRLRMVMLGSAAPNELVTRLQGSPFEVSSPIDTDDFSPQEMAGLAAGLGVPGAAMEAVLTRVWNWTRGHPYLSQKVCRGLARRREDELTPDLVDELVHTQFLTPTVMYEEPHISAIAARVLRADSGRNARLNLYGRIRKGVEVLSNPASPAERDLLLAGLVAVDERGRLQVRNEIYAMTFSTRWANEHLPFGFRGVAVAAAVIAALIALPVWYTEYLPRPHIKALSAANQDYQAAEDAYRSLAGLPGYGDMADRLFEDFLVRASRGAAQLADVRRLNNRLESLPDAAGLDRKLLAEYWQRRAASSMQRGDRDAALVEVLESLREPDDRRRRLAAELIGTDYPRLRASLHLRAPLAAMRADRDSGLLTVLDRQNEVRLWRLGEVEPEPVGGMRVIAEERLQIEQRRAYPSVADDARLILRLDHAQPTQVDIALRSPAGREARLRLDQAATLPGSLYVFDFTRFPQLRQLLEAERAGNWTLLLTDREQGVAGSFSGWEIAPRVTQRLAEILDPPLPVPEPRATVNALAVLSEDGRLALSWPANPDTPGPLLVWDVAAGRVIARLPRTAELRSARFALDDTRIMTTGASSVTLWDSRDGQRISEFTTAAVGQPRFTLSANGRYAGLPVQQADARAGVAVWDLESGRRIRVVDAAADAAVYALDNAGRYLAIGGRDAYVRLWSLEDGSLLREFSGSSAIRALRFSPDGAWLASDDRGHTLRLWSVAQGGKPLLERNGGSPWLVAFAVDSAQFIAGSPDRSYEVYPLPEGLRVMEGFVHTLAADRTRETLAEPLLFGALNLAVTSDTEGTVKLWQLPPGLPPRLPGRSMPADLRVSLSPDGKQIAAGSDIDSVRIYAAGSPGGVLLSRAPGDESPGAALVGLRFSPDQTWLAGGAMDGRVRIWNTASGNVVSDTIVHADGPVQSLLFSADGERLFSASGREVQVTATAGGTTLARLRIQADRPQLAYANATGDLFVAGDEGGVTRWNWGAGISATVITGEFDITRIAVTTEADYLVTANNAREVRVWNVSRRIPLERILRTGAHVDRLWLADDDRRLIVQAGPWLYSAGLAAGGVLPRATRLVGIVPAAAQPQERGRSLALLSSSPQRPVLQTVQLDESPAVPVGGDAETLQQLGRLWQQRLALGIAADGTLVPDVPDELPGY